MKTSIQVNITYRLMVAIGEVRQAVGKYRP